jgi:hypothetical protein
MVRFADTISRLAHHADHAGTAIAGRAPQVDRNIKP